MVVTHFENNRYLSLENFQRRSYLYSLGEMFGCGFDDEDLNDPPSEDVDDGLGTNNWLGI
jgi:hypothetical protein